MKLFLSDLHLGSPLFDKENEIKQLFNCNKYDEVFIIGDIIDTWENSVKTITLKYESLIQSINTSVAKVYIIKGNHDPKIIDLKRIFYKCHVLDNKELNLNGKKTLLIHGHEFDGVMVKYLGINKLLFPIQWLCERLNLNISNWLNTTYHSVAAKISDKHYNDIVLEIEKRVIEKYKDYDILIMGHTHLEKFVYTYKPVYINTGSLIHDPSYLEYDSGIFVRRRL